MFIFKNKYIPHKKKEKLIWNKLKQRDIFIMTSEETGRHFCIHAEHYKHMYNRTNTFKFIFIPLILKDWNSLDYSTITNAELTTNSTQNFADAVRTNHAGC